MKKSLLAFLILSIFTSLAYAQNPPATNDTTAPADDSWVKAMQKVHARFDGPHGTLANFGDSITFTRAYWAGLQYKRLNASKEMDQAYQRVSKYMPRECWADWKGPEFGSESGMTVLWAKKNVDAWLAKLHPETATLMFGTNDLKSVSPADYEAALREVVAKCLDKGTVVILSTIPPRHGMDDLTPKFVQIERRVASDFNLPLIDFYAEIMQRRPRDWDGAADQFKQYKDYDIPTLISRDGVHPSAPTKYDGDYSPEGLKNNGYALRSYLTLMKYNEVIEKILQPPAASPGR